MFINAEWFQDLFLYELHNLQMATSVMADPGLDSERTVNSEVVFSFKNAGGWRQVEEHARRAPLLSTWHQEHGGHRIFANSQSFRSSSLVQANSTSNECVWLGRPPRRLHKKLRWSHTRLNANLQIFALFERRSKQSSTAAIRHHPISRSNRSFKECLSLTCQALTMRLVGNRSDLKTVGCSGATNLFAFPQAYSSR